MDPRIVLPRLLVLPTHNLGGPALLQAATEQDQWGWKEKPVDAVARLQRGYFHTTTLEQIKNYVESTQLGYGEFRR